MNNNVIKIILNEVENGDIYDIHIANFMITTIDYIQNNDYAMYLPYQLKTHQELLKSSQFKDFLSKLYDLYLDSNEYNIHIFMEDNYYEIEELLGKEEI